MSDGDLFAAWGDGLVDFWGRRENGPRIRRAFHLFGWPVILTSNRPECLQAVDVSLPLFSAAPARDLEPLHVHIAVRQMPVDPGPVPDDLFTRIQYSGHGEWLAMHIGAWGLAHMALGQGHALAVIAPQLAQNPDRLSRHVLNTIFLNLLENRGFSLLHATSVVHGDRILLLLGQHNSGKSTTALRLALHGYDFMADSMTFIAPFSDEMQLSGFPVGLAKLRPDMLPSFPELQALFQREITREEVKFDLDLRRVDKVSVRQEAVIAPHRIDLYLLQRHEGRDSRLAPVAPEDVFQALFHNSAYWHSAEFWQRHIARLQRLLAAARCRRLLLGSDTGSLLEALDG